MFADNEGEVEVEHIHAHAPGVAARPARDRPRHRQGLLADKPDLCNRMIVEFLQEAEVMTAVMPRQRLTERPTRLRRLRAARRPTEPAG